MSSEEDKVSNVPGKLFSFGVMEVIGSGSVNPVIPFFHAPRLASPSASRPWNAGLPGTLGDIVRGVNIVASVFGVLASGIGETGLQYCAVWDGFIV